MPSTSSTSVATCRPSSTVITPSLPTFNKASARICPIALSLLPAILATVVIAFLSVESTGFEAFRSCSTTQATAF